MSVEMPTGKIQDFPPSPMTHEKVRRSPFGVGCINVANKKDVAKDSKLLALGTHGLG